MKRWMAPAALLFTVLGCGGAGEDANSNLPMNRRYASPAEVERATKSLSQGRSARVPVAANEFGFRLYAELLKGDSDKNVFVSPASISTALAMAYNGAGGSTKQAMMDALGFEGLSVEELNAAQKSLATVLSSPDPKVRLDIANSLWAKAGVEFKREFLSRVEESYGAKPTVLDFSSPDAAKTINDWVSQSTQEKIKGIVEKIESNTVMFLLNAVYFKGQWGEAFDPKKTEDREFTTFPGKKAKVPMMSRRDEFEYLQGEGFRSVRIPYGAGRVGLYLFLPDEGKTLKDFHKALNSKNWTKWMGGYKLLEGTVVMPKFKSEYKSVLNEPLSKLGMGVAFTDKADFSGMRDQRDLYLQEVVHKTFVEVNEEGTEAAAVTEVKVGVTSAPAPKKEFLFVADKPFCYAIVDKTTGVILFLGAMGDPKT